MARFRFKLEAVLQHRRNLEDVAQRELAKTLRQRMILTDQLRSMQQTITESKRQLGDGLSGRVDLDQIGQFARYSGQVRLRAQAIVVRLAGVEKEIQAARERLMEATRDRKALELLEERQRQAWQAEQDRREAAELDDLAVGAYARRLVAGEVQ